MAAFTNVAKASEIAVGSSKVVEAGGKTLAIFNCDGTYYALSNTCAHQGGPLGEGSLDGTTVTCPWHGWEFDVTSGACQMDTSMKVERFEVKVEGEDLLVAV